MTPSGIPTRSERPTAASISASVCMLASHRPISANERERPDDPRAGAPAAEAQGDERPGSRRADPRQPEEQAVEPLDEVVHEGREPVEDGEHEARILGVPLVEQPGLEARRGARERVPRRGSPATGTRAARPGTRATISADDRAPPGRSGRATTADVRRPVGRRRARSRRTRQPPSPAIAFSTATRSTTPTTRPSSTAQTGRSFAASTGTASRTVVPTSSRGPSSLLARLRVAHDPTQRQDVAARDVARRSSRRTRPPASRRAPPACRAGRSRRRA